MKSLQVLLVAGTHGNEINAPWLIDQWAKSPDLIETNGVKVTWVIGNPAARKEGKRYLDSDLNRSFSNDFSSLNDRELLRANELSSTYGPKGTNPCQIALDFHSTTSAMGSSVVVYGRRPSDLGLASLIQARLGLPIYLHEGDQSQTGFLVESWPCGLVIEIGPVSQSLLHSRIVRQTQIVLETCLELIAKASSGLLNYPDRLVIHKHLGSIDFPRDLSRHPSATIHPQLQGADWKPIKKGSPLFLSADGDVVSYQGNDSPIPVFINEAAYAEKNIAMSLTKREVLRFEKGWGKELNYLLGSQ